MPMLSIIIPTFNSVATIERCLRSIAVQTFTDYEIIVQDGSPNDDTARAIERFQEAHQNIAIRLHREPDSGIYDAMNKARAKARGEWLYFLGSDDEFYNDNVLSRVLGCRDAANTDVLYGNVQMDGTGDPNADGAIYDGPFDLSKLLTKNICHQAIFYRAAFAARVGRYNPKYVVLADWDFNMRCWAKGRFSYVDMIVARFHFGGDSTQGKVDARFRADVTANIVRYFWRQGRRTGLYSRATPSKVLGAFARKLGITR